MGVGRVAHLPFEFIHPVLIHKIVEVFTRPRIDHLRQHHWIGVQPPGQIGQAKVLVRDRVFRSSCTSATGHAMVVTRPVYPTAPLPVVGPLRERQLPVPAPIRRAPTASRLRVPVGRALKTSVAVPTEPVRIREC